MLFKYLFSLATLAVSAQAASIVAYGGTDCSGSVGDTVQCDGGCHAFRDRHSLKISGGGKYCVTYYEQANCYYATSQVRNAVLSSGQCTHVDTGAPVQSFKCSSSTLCFANLSG